METITAPARRQKPKKAAKKNIADSYNTWKDFEGQQYTGMKVGRRHKWYYDKGDWKEQKITPDKWKFEYSVVKRRAGHAPEGSGVPVGTKYHWYIVADQTATKLNANDYTTSMSGYKFKVAHKRFDKDKWSLSDQAQRKRTIKILQEMIRELEETPIVPIEEESGLKKPEKKVAKTKKKAVAAS